MKSYSLLTLAVLLSTVAVQYLRADAYQITEFNAAGGPVQVIDGGPSPCDGGNPFPASGNPFPATGSCSAPFTDFNTTTFDGDYTIYGDYSVVNVGGLFQLLSFDITVTDNTGVNGSISFATGEQYVFNGPPLTLDTPPEYPGFIFMNGDFATAAANPGTNVVVTGYPPDFSELPTLGASAADPDAGAFSRGPGFGSVLRGTGRVVFLTSDAAFSFQAGAAQAAGDSISLTSTVGDAPEPASMILFCAGLLGIAGYRLRHGLLRI